MDSDAGRAGQDDPLRIEAARRLLAEAPGEALDRLAALSARLLGAAYAQIALRTDELVTLTPTPPRQPPADALIAQVTDTPLALADIQDTPGIGSFLGVPIEAAGAFVGVLCVYDPDPCDWTGHDVEVLRELAGTVAAELERGALASELESSTVRLDLGFAAAQIGSFDWNLETNALHWDERMIELFGYTQEAFVEHIDSFVNRVHPDDRERVDAAIRRAVDACGEFGADYRVVHPDGSVHWIAARGRALCDPAGRPARMLGAAYDTTAVHSAAERLGRVLETMSTAFLTLDRDWTFTYVNAAAERVLGRRRDELVGRVIWDVYPELVGTDNERAYRRAVETGKPVSLEQYYPPLDTWFDVRATPAGDGLSVYFHDVTDRVRAEQDAARLATEREEALAAARAATGRLQILSGASARLAGTLEVAELVEILADVVLNGFGGGVAIALAAGVVGDEPGEGFRIAHVSGLDPALAGRTVTASALVDGTAIGDVDALTLPLISRGRMLGALVVVDPVESALDRRVLVELAARAGVALDNAALYAAERRHALTLQRSLLPSALPALPGIALAARYLPGTGGREVGGDFYIAHTREDGRLVLMIGDVMGHGTQAAARMGQLRAVLSAYAYEGDPPDRVLARLSARAPALLDVPMATVLAGVYDPERRLLTFSLAGHLPPLLAPLDAEPAFVAAPPAPPLGVGGSDFTRHTVEVPARATLVFYTDGLIEERRRPIDEGLERLRSALVDVRLPPEAVCDHVLRTLGRDEGAEDDIALLVMNHAA